MKITKCVSFNKCFKSQIHLATAPPASAPASSSSYRDQAGCKAASHQGGSLRISAQDMRSVIIIFQMFLHFEHWLT